MHFVGMLAFSMDAPIFYDVRMTTTSLLLPVAATWLGLSAACRFSASAGGRSSPAGSSSDLPL